MVSRNGKLVLGALGVGAAVGLAHFGTHSLAGDPAAFDRAGVTEAGLASAAAAGIGAGLLARSL